MGKKNAKSKPSKRKLPDIARKDPGPDDERYGTLKVLVEVPVFCRPSQEEKMAQRLLRDVKLSCSSRARGWTHDPENENEGFMREVIVPDHMNE